MTKEQFIKDTKFFFTDFHLKGDVNIALHITSITFLIRGLRNKDLILVILGLAVIDELGHIYNYYFPRKKDPKYNPIRMIPYQMLYVVPPAILALKVFGFF